MTNYTIEDIPYMQNLEVVTIYGRRYIIGPKFVDTFLWAKTIEVNPIDEDWHAIDIQDVLACKDYDKIRATMLFKLIKCG